MSRRVPHHFPPRKKKGATLASTDVDHLFRPSNSTTEVLAAATLGRRVSSSLLEPGDAVSPNRLINPRCDRSISNPDLGLIADLHCIASRIDRVEECLFLVEIGAIERIPERNHPSRISAARADLKLHCEHWLSSLSDNVDLPASIGSIEREEHCRGSSDCGDQHWDKAIANDAGEGVIAVITSVAAGTQCGWLLNSSPWSISSSWILQLRSTQRECGKPWPQGSSAQNLQRLSAGRYEIGPNSSKSFPKEF
jgi:hypothetical protein